MMKLYFSDIARFGCILGACAAAALLSVSPQAMAQVTGQTAANSITTDSRIRTLVYNTNEVYRIVTYPGYQSHIELGENEQILTISLGDQVGWKIVPSGRYVFIKAMTDNSRTNMTIITDKRSYQFDLHARAPSSTADRDLAYVVRFFYPENMQQETVFSMQAPTGPSAPFASTDGEYSDIDAYQPAPPPTEMAYGPGPSGARNYQYTLSGSEEIAPIKVFDDGVSTYFQFASPSISPFFSLVHHDGFEEPVVPEKIGEYFVVNTVGNQFVVRSGSRLVCVYNEAIPMQSYQ